MGGGIIWEDKREHKKVEDPEEGGHYADGAEDRAVGGRW